MSTALVWQSSDEQLLAELGALETQLHATWAQMLSVVAEVDSRGLATAREYGSTVELVRAPRRNPHTAPELVSQRATARYWQSAGRRSHHGVVLGSR
jgi:hypothetical protein